MMFKVCVCVSVPNTGLARTLFSVYIVINSSCCVCFLGAVGNVPPPFPVQTEEKTHTRAHSHVPTNSFISYFFVYRINSAVEHR